MKTILLLTTFFSLHCYGQCWEKISEPQDTTSMSFSISTDGTLWGWGIGILGNGNLKDFAIFVVQKEVGIAQKITANINM